MRRERNGQLLETRGMEVKMTMLKHRSRRWHIRLLLDDSKYIIKQAGRQRDVRPDRRYNV